MTAPMRMTAARRVAVFALLLVAVTSFGANVALGHEPVGIVFGVVAMIALAWAYILVKDVRQ